MSYNSPLQYSGTIRIHIKGAEIKHLSSCWWTYREMKSAAFQIAKPWPKTMAQYTWSYSPADDAVIKKGFTNRKMFQK